jgi:streptogrisin D
MRMSHRRITKRTGIIAAAGAAAIAAAAIILPNANASTDVKPGTFDQKAAVQLGTTLAASLGDSAAGWYYDGGKDQVVFNVLTESAADDARARGAVARIVQNSMARLTSATTTLSSTASIPGTAWSIDPKTNKVVVVADSTVTGTKLAQLTQATSQLGDGVVTVKRSAGAFEKFDGKNKNKGNNEDEDQGAGDAGAGDAGAGDAGAGIVDENGDGIDDAQQQGAGDAGDAGAGDAGAGAGIGAEAAGVDGGDAIFGGGSRCSLGFNVDVDGAPGFLTAGHCGNIAETWASDQQGADQVGTTKTSVFPVSDFALVLYDDPATAASSTVDLTDGTTQAINQAAEAAVGMAVQKSGSTTGLSDGEVTGLNATVNYGNGDIVNGLIQTSVCAEPGDSGGPLFAADSAVGLTSGGSGDCTVGGETFFQPVTTALEAVGATIGTGDAGAGDAGAGAGAGDVGAGDASASPSAGIVDENGDGIDDSQQQGAGAGDAQGIVDENGDGIDDAQQQGAGADKGVNESDYLPSDAATENVKELTPAN